MDAVLGIDIGGSGIKGAPVNLETGELLAERHRIPTPQPATPEAVANVIAQLVTHFDWKSHVGCTFPAVVKNGVTYTAANVDQSWINADADSLFERKTGLQVHMLNDADAAGLAELQFGAGKGHEGLVMLLTFGTGIGSALMYHGVLVPNTELGHLEIRGKDAEHRASDRVREEKDLDWEKWGERVNEYLNRVEALFWPDLFIIGGGVSKKFDKFKGFLSTRAPIVPAMLLNDAGIVGAAFAAGEHFHLSKPKKVHRT